MAAEQQRFSEATLEAQARHQETISAMESRWRARQIAIPSNDRLVMLRLRELGQPVCLFGEGPADRRERIREVLAKVGSDQALPTSSLECAPPGAATSSDLAAPVALRDVMELDVVFGARLKRVREWLVHYSLQRARRRVARGSNTAATTCPALEWTNACSQVGDDRPLSGICAAGSEEVVATCSWTGVVKLWDPKSCGLVRTLKHGHDDRALGVSVNHVASSACHVASCDASGFVALWPRTREESVAPIATLNAHPGAKANRVAFHPSGLLLGTTGSDRLWRLWDVERRECLLPQDGHSRGVYGIRFHPDGGLCATGGEDAYVRVWDLRNGQCVTMLEGHIREVLALDWRCDGCTLASASDDHSVRLWDLRSSSRSKTLAIIPAHSSLVSCVKFSEDGSLLASGSFDNTVKLWGVEVGCQYQAAWRPVAVLKGHESRIVGLDFLRSEHVSLVTASFDRTWKVWQGQPGSQT